MYLASISVFDDIQSLVRALDRDYPVSQYLLEHALAYADEIQDPLPILTNAAPSKHPMIVRRARRILECSRQRAVSRRPTHPGRQCQAALAAEHHAEVGMGSVSPHAAPWPINN